MPRGSSQPPTVAIHVVIDDAAAAIPDLTARIAAAGGTLRTLSTTRRLEATDGPPGVELEIEVEDL